MTRWGRVGFMGWLLMGVLCLWAPAAHAGKLSSVRSSVSGSSSSSGSRGSSSSSSSSSSSGSSRSSYSSYGYGYRSPGSYCCTSGTSGTTVTTDVPKPPLSYRHYPYEGGASDYMFQARPTDDHPRKIAGQVWGEGAWQGQGLWRSAAGLRIDGRFFGFDGDLSYYLEPAAKDALYLGTSNLSFIPIRARRGLFRIGGGFNTMIDGRVPGQAHREYALGWNVTSSFDLYPVWPLVISVRGDAGQLYHAFMGRARASVGVMLWRMEIFGGYEHTQVGRVGLGGPMVGIRMWL